MFAKVGLRSVVVAVAALGLVACASQPPKDVVDTVAGTGQTNTLAQAIKAAGLDSTLKGKGPYTVFAPSDQAFKALPAGTVETLLKPENKAQLTKILSYHVVPGNVTSSTVIPDVNTFGTNTALFNRQVPLKTVEGSEVSLSRWQGTWDGVWVNNIARVTKPNVTASNGVVHVVDRVLLPKQ